MKLLALLLLFGLSWAEDGNRILDGIKTVRVIYGRVDRDFADQTATMQNAVNLLNSLGIEAVKDGTPGSVHALVVLDVECTQIQEPAILAKSLICTLHLEVFTAGTAQYGGKGMVRVYGAAAPPQIIGQMGIKASVMNDAFQSLVKDFAAEVIKQHLR